MSTDKNLADVRNLIVCDTQFGWTGSTTLQLQQMLALQERGWLAEGEENDEFDLTDAGREVVARALQSAIQPTLADVQPGGRVRLGDQALRVFSAGRWTYDGTGQSFSHEEMDAAAFVVYRDAALSAQPSPGGQDALAALVVKWRAEAASHELNGLEADSIGLTVAAMRNDARHHILEAAADELEAALAARQPVGEPAAWLVHWSDMPMESPEVTRSASRIAEVSALTHPPRVVPLYAVPPAQAVDVGQFRAQVAELLRREFDLEVADPGDHRHDDGAEEADRIAGTIAALIDRKAVGE